MGKCCKFVVYAVALMAAWIGYKTHNVLYEIPPLPDLPLNQWWGPGVPPAKMDTSIRPFKIEFTKEMLSDLRQRISMARYHETPLENVGFQYGFNTIFLKSVVNYWKNGYNFVDRQNYLNKYPHFKTNIQGLDIHFVHIKPNVQKDFTVYPILLLHGWPGSFIEFYKAIPYLSTPHKTGKFAFELIIPSLPGYGFSQGASKTGLGAAQMSVVMKNLMNRLGHEKYLVQGGDWGSLIGGNMAILFPENVMFYHTNMPVVSTPMSNLKYFIGTLMPSLIVDKQHESRMYPAIKMFEGILEETGYMHIQATKPDTVGAGLTDSPIGLAAYILEKFSTWTNREWKNLPDGGLTKKFNLDELLDNIMIYWMTNSITTSVRLYSESFNKAHEDLKLTRIPITIPTAICRCDDLKYDSDTLLKEKYYNMIQTTDHDNCGHFAIFEEPQKIAEDIINAVLKFKTMSENKTTKKEL